MRLEVQLTGLQQLRAEPPQRLGKEDPQSNPRIRPVANESAHAAHAAWCALAPEVSI